MKKQVLRRWAWLGAALMTGAMYALIGLALEMRYAMNDDTFMLRTFMGYEGSIPSFHLLLHGLLCWLLKLLGESYPGVAWFSIFQIAFLAFACVLTVKSLIQCFVNRGRSFWLGVAFGAVFLAAFYLEICTQVTFTCTAAALGAAAVLQLMSIDWEDARPAQVLGGILLALVPAVLAYALRQEAIFPVLGFCALALGYGLVCRRPSRGALRAAAAGVLTVAVVLGGLALWRSAEKKANAEFVRWSRARSDLIDYYALNDLSPEILEQAGWDENTVKMAKRFCFLNPAMTTESMETLLAYEQAQPRENRVETGAALAASTLLGNERFRLTVEVAAWVLLGCMAALALGGGSRRGWQWTALALNIGLFAACLLYLGVRGRLPLRAVRMAMLPLTAALFGMLPNLLPPKRTGRVVGLCCLALCVAWTGWYTVQTAPGLLPDENYEMEVGNPAATLDEYALSEPEMLFIYDDSLISDARMFPDVSEGIPTNVAFWGGWGFRSESSYRQFAAYEIDLDEMDAEMWLREDICLASAVLDPPPRLMLSYLQEQVDSEVDYNLYGEDGGVYFFQFY